MPQEPTSSEELKSRSLPLAELPPDTPGLVNEGTGFLEALEPVFQQLGNLVRFGPTYRGGRRGPRPLACPPLFPFPPAFARVVGCVSGA